MSGNKLPLICWDSCVFLAWFKKEGDKPLDAIQEILTAISNDKLILLVSAVCCTEVLNESGKTDARTQFNGFVKRRSVQMVDVDWRIANLAADIREWTKAECDAKRLAKSVRAPDALIIATAVTYHADQLHTFDPDMLAISAQPIIKGLPILRPDSTPPGHLF